MVPQTSNRLLDILKDCSGIITETPGINSHAAIVGLALDLPVLVGAENATKLLKSGTTVKMCIRDRVYSHKRSNMRFSHQAGINPGRLRPFAADIPHRFQMLPKAA